MPDAEVAARIHRSPAAFAALEAPDAQLGPSILRPITAALGWSLEQLDF